MISRILLTISAAVLGTAAQSHQSNGYEHIIIIDPSQPTPPDVADVLQRISLHADHTDVRHIFNNSAFSGFTASIKSHCFERLNNMSDILVVEQSSKLSNTAVIRREPQAYQNRGYATWGLARISDTFFRGTDTHAMDYTYSFKNSALGKGADVYIIDSGIWTEHEGFEGRAKMIWAIDGNMTDTDGHGTHVAGTAAGIDFGVASNANVFGVRVLDAKGGGSTATVIAGIDQVIQHHDQRRRSDPNFVGSVMSISLAASGTVSALDQAIAAAVQAGIHTCVAAGNNAQDACSASPSSSGGTHGPAITVGSVGISGQRSSFSNYGNCVDVYAPGEDILSAGLKDPLLLAVLTGTSQATPHVTGMIAYAMANKTLAQSPALMKEWVRMTGLPMGDGTIMANNGADGKSNSGMLGFIKQQATSTQSKEFIASESGLRVETLGRRDVHTRSRSGWHFRQESKRNLMHWFQRNWRLV